MLPADDRLNIDTPENVVFGYTVAGIGSRFLAALVDTILIVLLQAVVQLTILALWVVARNQGAANLEGRWGWLAAIFGVVSFIFLWGYYIYFETAWNGQTPGKRWARLRVIRADGTPITLSEAVIRNLVRLVDFLPVAYGIGIVSMFVDRLSRRLGDLAAGTLVVHDHGALSLAQLGRRQRAIDLTTPQAALASIENYPLKRLSDQDIQVIEDFLRRRGELANREQVGRQVLSSLLKKMGVPEEATRGPDVEDMLAAILHASRQWE